MRQAGGTQVAIANGGGIRAPLTKGTLTLGICTQYYHLIIM